MPADSMILFLKRLKYLQHEVIAAEDDACVSFYGSTEEALYRNC